MNDTVLYKEAAASPEDRARDLLSRMTLQEKIGQLNQRLYGFSVYIRDGENISLTGELKDEVKKYNGLGVLYGLYRADPWSGRNASNGLTGKLAVKAYNLVQRYVIEHSRLGIPMLLTTEAPHGHQALGGYLLPVNLAVGATFHPQAYKEASKVCGRQLKDMGVNLALVSMLDILRDPRWGRSEECYGEDPYLAARFAEAAVEGMQEAGVGVVAKHFCAQGEGTGGINASAARIGERELREIHLPVVKAACSAGVRGIMAAYNEIDGIPCHANKKLLNDILRDEMGFRGVVMSDGVAIDQLDIMTGDRAASGALALKSGVDIGLWDTGFARLEEALDRGLVNLEQLDEAVFRVLTLKFEQGLFDHPYITECDSWCEFTYDRYPDALRLARESVVLLKNETSVLPINTDHIKTIAVIGPNADEIYHQMGDYTPPINEEEGVTVLKGIRSYVEQNCPDVKIGYAKGCDLFSGTPEMLDETVRLASSCDLTLLVLGGSSSRFRGTLFDSNGAAIVDGEVRMDCGEGIDSAELRLPGFQEKLAKMVAATGKPVVTILIQGRPYAFPEINECSKGVLCSFYPGMKGGQAIAEILFGRISPSGRLPVSIPRHTGQLPVYYNYKASYRGMNYYDLEKQPLYTFGFGLSYTVFEYEEIRVEEISQNGVKLDFVVSNTGDFDSYAVPQLYIRHISSGVVPRVRELKAFEKVWVPAKSKVSCSLYISKESLSVWNTEMKYVPEPGPVELYLSDQGQDLWKGSYFIN
jgi:beta-glucosidase